MHAQDFYEIQDALQQNSSLKGRVVDAASNEPIRGKVTEGGDRVAKLRQILTKFFEGDISLDESIEETSAQLLRQNSPHSHSNRVFARGWDERLIRTQASRFYNQSVLNRLKEQGEQRCYIPHSPHEDRDSKCTKELAGGEASVDTLLDRLNRAYARGDWHDEVKIPNHPHCTHTVVPLE